MGKTTLLQALAVARARRLLFSGAHAKPSRRRGRSGRCSTWGPTWAASIETLVAAAAPRHQVFSAFATTPSQDGDRRRCAVFEDVHWADEATLDLLRYISRRIQPDRRVDRRSRGAPTKSAPTIRCTASSASCRRMRRIAIALHPLSLDAVTRMAGSHARRGDGVRAHERQSVLRHRGAARRRQRRAGQRARRHPRQARVAAARRATGRGSRVGGAGASRDRAGARERDVGHRGVPARRGRWPPDVRRPGAGIPARAGKARGRSNRCRCSACRSCIERCSADCRRVADRPGVLARLVHHAVGAGDGDAVQRFAVAAARQAAALGAHREAAAHYRTALAWADGLDPFGAGGDRGSPGLRKLPDRRHRRRRAMRERTPSRCGVN